MMGDHGIRWAIGALLVTILGSIVFLASAVFVPAWPPEIVTFAVYIVFTITCARATGELIWWTLRKQ